MLGAQVRGSLVIAAARGRRKADAIRVTLFESSASPMLGNLQKVLNNASGNWAANDIGHRMRIHELRKDDFYVPVLRTLDELGGSGQVEEIDNRVIEMTGLTAEDLAATYEKSGALMVPDKISWARSYLRQGGLLKNEGRGLWVLTEEGRDRLTRGEAAVHSAVAEAMKAYSKAYAAKKAEQKAARTVEIIGNLDQGPSLQFEESFVDWADQLLSTVQTMHPAGFERLCQRLLSQSWFHPG